MRKVKQAFILIIGFTFLILGILGLVLPFLQGILFIVIGIFILSFFSPKIHLWISSHTEKYPDIHSKIIKIEEWIKKMIGQV